MGYLCANLRAVRLRAGASPKAAFSAVTFRHVSAGWPLRSMPRAVSPPSWSPKSPHTPPGFIAKRPLISLMRINNY